MASSTLHLTSSTHQKSKSINLHPIQSDTNDSTTPPIVPEKSQIKLFTSEVNEGRISSPSCSVDDETEKPSVRPTKKRKREKGIDTKDNTEQEATTEDDDEEEVENNIEVFPWVEGSNVFFPLICSKCTTMFGYISCPSFVRNIKPLCRGCFGVKKST
jgi:formylmethanofuran dehydrogenase subunit E